MAEMIDRKFLISLLLSHSWQPVILKFMPHIHWPCFSSPVALNHPTPSTGFRPDKYFGPDSLVCTYPRCMGTCDQERTYTHQKPRNHYLAPLVYILFLFPCVKNQRLVSRCPITVGQPLTDFAVVKKKNGDVMTPIFITCDPARDTPPVVSCISFTEPNHRIDIGPSIIAQASQTKTDMIFIC